MKRTILSFVLVFALGMTTFLTASSNPAGLIPSAMEVDNSEMTVSAEDALHCKKANSQGDTVSCWFCNCDDLPDIPDSPVDERGLPSPALQLQ